MLVIEELHDGLIEAATYRGEVMTRAEARQMRRWANHSDAAVVAVYNTSTTFGRVTSRPHFTRATNSTMIKGSAAKATPDHSDAERAFLLSLSIRLGNVPCMTVGMTVATS